MTQKKNLKNIILTGIALNSALLVASPLSFQHHDWEMSCDNTNFCRIAGYSSDETKYRVSVLLEIKAGKNQSVKAKVQLASFNEEDEKIFQELPSTFKVEMLINNKHYGSVRMNKEHLIAPLSKKQTEALLASLKKKSNIIWKTKHYTWKLSDKGASAVLLKVDEFQKRLGTIGALYKKGDKNEDHLLRSKGMPHIQIKKLSSDKNISIKTTDMKLLEKKLTLSKDECFSPYEDDEIRLYPLSSNKLLASKLCWMAAYNYGSAYWVINNKPPFKPKLITLDGSEYFLNNDKVGTISSHQKGRGMGDCFSYESFVWTGKTFKQNSKGTTGLCRAIAGGGAWELPTFVSKVE